VTADEVDPVGAVEIAERLGVARRTVDQWRQRPTGFPVPRWTVGGRPAWNWSDVAGWYAARP
jgi:predicted DNA-binding transcriptional regulator AlpA